MACAQTHRVQSRREPNSLRFARLQRQELIDRHTGRQIMNRRRTACSLGLSWRELWERVKSGAASLASATVGALSSALQQGAQWVVTELEVFIDGVREVYQFVLDSAQKIGEFAGMILSTVAVTIEKAIDWVSALFDWEDILRTKNYLRGIFETGLAEFELAADELASAAEEYFENLGTDLLAELETVKARLGDQTLADTSGGHGTEEDVDATEQNNVQSAWVTSTIAQEPHGALPNFALPPGYSEFQEGLTQLWRDVTAVLEDPRVREAFARALGDLQQIFARPASAATIVPRLLIDALEGLLLVGIDVAKVLVGGLLRLAKYGFAALRSLVSAEAPMPMLSALYRRISGGMALSLLDAGCLAVAVPFTITHKLMHGRAPFPAPDARSPRSDEEDAAMIDTAYIASLGAWGLVDALLDAPGSTPWMLGLFIQHAEGDRRDHEEVHRSDRVPVVAEERPPALERVGLRWPSSQVPRDRAL